MASLRWERKALGPLIDLPPGWRARVVAHAAHLRRFPEMGTPALGAHLGKRRLIVGPYSVLYKYDPAEDVVSIAGISRGGPHFR